MKEELKKELGKKTAAYCSGWETHSDYIRDIVEMLNKEGEFMILKQLAQDCAHFIDNTVNKKR